MPITVSQLITHLENVVKDGKGDLPVYLVNLVTENATPLERGDTVNMAGKKFFCLVPEPALTITH